jgi:transposase
MKRFKPIDNSQSFFLSVNNDFIHENYPLIEVIEQYFSQYFNPTAFIETISNDTTGAPAFHPSVILKVIFYAYSKGIYSSRDIEGLCRSDYAAIYLTANKVIDHSTICRFIVNHKNAIVSFFTKMVYVLRQMDLIDYNILAIDGTKIRANASKEFSGNVRDFKDKRSRIEKKLKAAMEDTERSTPRIEKKIDRFTKSIQKIDAFLEEADEKSSDKVNLTDRDARLVKDGGSIVVGYNCQNAVDSKHHFIVGNNVNNHASDRNELVPMIDKIEDNLHDDSKLTADAGYFSSDNLIYADKYDIDLYLPEGKNEDGSQKKKDGDSVKSKDCGLSQKDDTKYLTCPGGYRSATKECFEDRGVFNYRFYVPASQCAKCIHREHCNPNYDKNRSKRFNVKREYFESAPLRRKMNKKLYSKAGRSIYNQRSCLVEHVFGEIKVHKRFTRFYHRGLAKVNTIWNIICIAHNFRKLAALNISP